MEDRRPDFRSRRGDGQAERRALSGAMGPPSASRENQTPEHNRVWRRFPAKMARGRATWEGNSHELAASPGEVLAVGEGGMRQDRSSGQQRGVRERRRVRAWKPAKACVPRETDKARLAGPGLAQPPSHGSASAHGRPLVATARIRTVLLWATGLELGLLGDF